MWERTAAAQAGAVREGRVTAVELVRAHLDRIAEVNPVVNAITRLTADRALADAAEVDRNPVKGPLAGVPFTVKENIALGGVPTTHGAVRFRDFTAPADAPPVARLRAVGAIPVGHTNMPTLALAGVHTRSELFGDTVNPWDPAVTPGGTSGGDGVAVATGMAALGLGNDSGGSVRIPATFCGVAGLKPTSGRFPADHRLGPDDPPLGAQLFVVDGPLARTAGDLRLAFHALAGADPRDPRAVPVPPTGEHVPRRVAVVADPGGLGVHPDVRRAVEDAAGALADAGYEVVDADVPRLDDALHAYGHLLMTEFAPSWPVVRTLLGAEGHRYLELSMAKAAPVDLPEYLRLTGVHLGVRRAWAEFLARYPLVLAPVFTEPAPAPGVELTPEGHDLVSRAMRLCTATSFAGLPAVAVPTGLAGGVPVGVQLIGRAYREDTCLDAAEVVERVLTPRTPA
ncbi:amidase family protein [Saccharothrix sp. BKS2]|uniref:amidase n=1 Tax=Saccharothrix sp. BKS2 TaxID=3064400 RepID=UPI0039E8F0EF